MSIASDSLENHKAKAVSNIDVLRQALDNGVRLHEGVSEGVPEGVLGGELDIVGVCGATLAVGVGVGQGLYPPEGRASAKWGL